MHDNKLICKQLTSKRPHMFSPPSALAKNHLSMSDANDVSNFKSSQDDANLPTKEECEKRCQQFAQITGTDTTFAMCCLQDQDWNLEKAFSAVSLNEKQKKFSTRDSDQLLASGGAASCSVSHTSKAGNLLEPNLNGQATYLPSKENSIRLLSWNIDGLDPNDLMYRAEGVCSVLLQVNPEIVFLQEIVYANLLVIQSRCARNYNIHFGIDVENSSPRAYFTAILLKKDCTNFECVNLTKFPTSCMSRTLLEVQCLVKSVPVTLLTSHLESTAECSSERKKQLGMAFSRMQVIPKTRTVLFGGDLNLRDRELTGASKKPQEVLDVWEVTGQHPQTRYTWDLTLNDNKHFDMQFQPRCRFDRMYLRNSDPPRLKPAHFELVGTQRLSSCQRFPSDHWGILCHFDIVN
ncbi:Tyrosyl-DNA phosphodiesterase 2 [Bulinus truncatus]|nr:Tyrosyl-DNA phosphodiesterase 2 [Bulinus truncatus]